MAEILDWIKKGFGIFLNHTKHRCLKWVLLWWFSCFLLNQSLQCSLLGIASYEHKRNISVDLNVSVFWHVCVHADSVVSTSVSQWEVTFLVFESKYPCLASPSMLLNQSNVAHVLTSGSVAPVAPSFHFLNMWQNTIKVYRLAGSLCPLRFFSMEGVFYSTCVLKGSREENLALFTWVCMLQSFRLITSLTSFQCLHTCDPVKHRKHKRYLHL